MTAFFLPLTSLNVIGSFFKCLFFCSCVLLIHYLLSLCFLLFVSSLFAVVYIYIFLTCPFLLDYFSPSLPLQDAVAATVNTSTVTTATAGAPGAPGGPPQGAPGSPSPGPASHSIPSVNEGTD